MDKMKILVIDDEAPIREVLNASLTDDGYPVRVAKSGEEGLAAIEEFRPNAVLLDRARRSAGARRGLDGAVGGAGSA